MSPARFRCATQLGYRTLVAGFMLLDGVLGQLMDYVAKFVETCPRKPELGHKSSQPRAELVIDLVRWLNWLNSDCGAVQTISYQQIHAHTCQALVFERRSCNRLSMCIE
jgi:hypothetical protein